MNNILDFGAVADGKTVNTKAIQAAIDAGGAVLIPRGEFVTGTLYLRSNGGLHLEAGAVLKASHCREDYNADDYCPQNQVFTEEFVTGAHLITAVEQENIFISGDGAIDGDSHYWMNGDERFEEGSITFKPNAERPGQMIYICECKNVNIRDVGLRNGSYWHLLLHGCENVIVRGLNISGERLQYTNDGIDIDCCKNVTVSDCVIDTGDDGITLRANGKTLKGRKDCENVTVTNCTIASYGDYGIRIGVGSGRIKNCSLSNIAIHDSQNGIGITARFSSASAGAFIENISFSNMQVRALRPLELRMTQSEDQPPLREKRHIKNILLSGLYAEGTRDSVIINHENGEMSGFVLRDCTFVCGGEGSFAHDRDERGMWSARTGDSALVIKNVDDLRAYDLRLSFREDAKNWKHGIKSVNTNASWNDCTVEAGIEEI